MNEKYKSSIYDLTQDDLANLFVTFGEPAFRISQVWEGLYAHLWSSPDDFTSLPKPLRQKISEQFAFDNEAGGRSFLSLQPVKKIESSDRKTTKTLFSIQGGYSVEAVLMRYDRRNTLCISTQAGCAMNCVFCATGQMGFKRNLSSGEIIEQVLFYARQLANEHEQVTNIVVMGMGEPFHNYDATMDSINRLNDPRGPNLGARRFTISTVGLIPGIQRFTAEHSQVNLAISLHAATDELRSQLLPINRKYPLDDLLSACLEYVRATHRRISFEWALIQGINDTREQAHLLCQRLKMFNIGGSSLCHVNVIPLNPTQKYTERASTHNNAVAFQQILEQAGIPCTIRLRRGIEIQAGCGQLAGQAL